MISFPVHDATTAPEGSREILNTVKQKQGFVPNLLGAVADAPNALAAYVTLQQLLEKGSLSATERQTIYLATSVMNGCTYCVASHTTQARGQKVPPEVVEAIRKKQPIPDPKLQALRELTEAIVKHKGAVPQATVERFLAAGYQRGQVLEVLLGVATKIVANYSHALTGAPIDQAFKANEWVDPG
jgi:uncharacterized peroxidase-related enzyme